MINIGGLKFSVEEVVEQIMEGNSVILKKYDLDDVMEQIWCTHGTIELKVVQVNESEVKVRTAE